MGIEYHARTPGSNINSKFAKEQLNDMLPMVHKLCLRFLSFHRWQRDQRQPAIRSHPTLDRAQQPLVWTRPPPPLPARLPASPRDLDWRPRPPTRLTDSPDCSEEVFTRESQTSPFIPPLRRPKGQMLSRTLILSVEMWRREVTLATGCCPDTCTAGSIHPGQHENFCKGER